MIDYTPPAIVSPDHRPHQALSSEEAFRLANEQNGVGAILIAVQEGRIDAGVAAEVINRVQTDTPHLVKRWIVAVLNSLIPG